jgi:hypothetical protein
VGPEGERPESEADGMSAILDLFRAFWRLLIWWVVIQPWEMGLRVRLGKHRKRLTPGLWFRIPHVDTVYKQSDRLRYTTMTSQTVTTRDGHTLTMSGQLGYAITDIDRLYDTLHQAENALRSMAQGAVAKYVHDHELAECNPAAVEAGAAATLGLLAFGLEYRALQLTTFCRVKTYRFIMDNHENIWEDLLDTRKSDQPGGP